MTKISEFNGIVVSMEFVEDNPVYKPHVHVTSGNHSAVIGFDHITVAGKIPRTQKHLLFSWMNMREKELYNAWYKAVQGKDVPQIEPLA